MLSFLRSFKSRGILNPCMDGAVRLGGNIELYGIENFDGATMVVLKKIIGMYARKFSDKGLERLAVSFAGNDIKIEAVSKGEVHSAESSHDNLYFALDSALKDVQGKI